MGQQGLTETLSYVAAEMEVRGDFFREIALQSTNLIFEEPLRKGPSSQRQRVRHGIQHEDLGARAQVRAQSRSHLQRGHGPGMRREKDDNFLPSGILPTRRGPAAISFGGGLCCCQSVRGNHLT